MSFYNELFQQSQWCMYYDREFVPLPYAEENNNACMYYNALCNPKRRHTVCMGEQTGHIVGRMRLVGQSQYDKCSTLVNFTAVTVSSTRRRGFSQIYLSWYFVSFWANFYQTKRTSFCKIIHFVKSDNQFPSISPNDSIGEAPSHPLLNLPL